MTALGHSIVLCRCDSGVSVRITLECSCGAVFNEGLFPVDDATNRHIIRDGGHAQAKAHLAQVTIGKQS